MPRKPKPETVTITIPRTQAESALLALRQHLPRINAATQAGVKAAEMCRRGIAFLEQSIGDGESVTLTASLDGLAFIASACLKTGHSQAGLVVVERTSAATAQPVTVREVTPAERRLAERALREMETDDAQAD